MTRQELITMCLAFPASVEDYPFEDNNCIIRHATNNKWIALIFDLKGQLCINLKCEPMQADFWRSIYHDCRPAWHMNKQHWNTIYVNGDVPLQELEQMLAHSFDLTKEKQKATKNAALRCRNKKA